MDDEILKTVHSIFGKSVQIVDCEKTSSVRQEEVLLINGIPVTLDGHDGDAIKSALLTGQVPSVELLNQLLYQAGILRQPVQLETSLSVKSSMVTTEEVSVARGGRILDGRTSETKEDYVYNSSKKEIWEPVAVKTGPERETMAYTPRFRLVQQVPPTSSASTSSSASSSTAAGAASASEGAVGGLLSEVPSAATVTHSATDMTNPILSGGSSSNHDFYYNYSGNERKRDEDEGDDDNDDDDDDDDDEDDDEDGELYLLNPQPTNQPSSPFANRLPPIRNATTTITSSRDYIHDHDLMKKYQKCSKSSMSGKKSSLLSYDSGHDGVYHSPSQQTATSNAMLAPALQPSTTNNTDHSISSCYDFISSDEADFLTTTAAAAAAAAATTTNNSNSNFGKNCKTIFATKERSYADLHREQPSPSTKSSNDKNVKSPFLGKKTSMSSSSCVSSSSNTAPSSQSKHQQASGSSKSTNAASDVVVSTTTTTTTTISTTSVENGLVFRDGNLISGPLDALIAHMVPTSNYYPDRSFIFSFLLSARLFIRPHELLARISETWEIQQQCHTLDPESVDVVDEKAAQPQSICCGNRSQQMYPPQFADKQSQQKAIKSAQNCIQLLAEWIDTFPYDFRDERLMQHVRVLARKCVYIDNSLGKTVSSILQNLVQRLTVLEKYEEFLQTLAANESNELSSTGEEFATHHHKPFSSSLSSGGHTNSGYVHAAGSISSNEREDSSAAVEASAMVATSSSIGIPHKTSVSSSHGATSSGSQQNQAIHHHTHHNSHQSDSSSNSVNTLGASGGGLGCTSAVSNGAELTDICDLCPNAALLAYQLTHIELERLSHIGPEEFVQAFAKENHLESFSDMKKTRNLESYVQWFNRLSYFTATEIVKYPKKKQRVRIIEFWIETARECFNIGNFNSLMAIIAGLNLSPISRLKKTWSKIQSAKFSVLEHQMDPTSNFNSYRSTLKAAMWRSEGATDERERIIIPFFSLLVKDLYFLNEGCSNRLPNGHINFEKFWQLAKQVMEFNTWKKVTCPFKKLPKVIMFLQMSPVLNENTLSMASFECEPPENNQEKGRYKTLKSETKQQQQQQQQQQHQQQQQQQT